MSSPSKTEDAELMKGGHPPAVKAGGMRIVQKKQAAQQPDNASPPKKVDGNEEEENGEESEVAKSPPKQKVVVSGVVTKGDTDFPKEAIQHFHCKPEPTHDSRPMHPKHNHQIQQPRGANH